MAQQMMAQNFNNRKQFSNSPTKPGSNIIVNTQTWQDAFKYSFYNPADARTTLSNFNKTQMHGMMRATNISRNKTLSRTGNSSNHSSHNKQYIDREPYGTNQSKTSSVKKQMLQSAYSNTKFGSDHKASRKLESDQRTDSQ
jgi:hypothetical protein